MSSPFHYKPLTFLSQCEVFKIVEIFFLAKSFENFHFNLVPFIEMLYLLYFTTSDEIADKDHYTYLDVEF